MDWIKRNLLFVIGAVVALLLMVAAGYYTWTGWSQNAAALEEINGKYETLKQLINANPNPGSGKVDNVRTAKEQQKEIGEAIGKISTRFTPIAPIPAESPVTPEAFASGLATTIYHLQQDATNSGVIVPQRYSFSFEQQSKAVRFEPGSLGSLAQQLGEVNAIMEVLIAAKINSLESIQRERVSPDDMAGPATDYLDQQSQTNELAIISPYQVTFRSFTPELALVLSGFAGSSRGIILKSLNVEPSVDVFDPNAVTTTAAPVYYQPNPAYPAVGVPPRGGREEGGGEAARRRAFADRYGINPRTPQQPQPAQPVYSYQPTAAVASGPKTVLDEKQLRVTMLLQVVKLLPKK